MAIPTFQAQPMGYGGVISTAGAPMAGLMGGLQQGLQMAQQMQQMRAAEQQRQAQMQQAQQAAAQQEQLQALRMQAAAGDPTAQQQLFAMDPQSAIQMQQLTGMQQEQEIEATQEEREIIGRTGTLLSTATVDTVRSSYERARKRIRKAGDNETDLGLPSREEAAEMTEQELLAAIKPVGQQLEALGLGPQPERAPVAQVTVGAPGVPPYKVPSGYMLKDPADPSKGVQPIPGTELEQKIKVGKFTDAQTTAANYANRMTQASDVMGRLEEAGITGAEISQALAEKVGPAGRFFMSPEHQVLKQAQDDWVRAKLRKESGAVIGVEEMEAERQTYFPVPGDSAKVIAAKRKAREEAEKGMIGQSGGAYKALFVKMTPEERSAPAEKPGRPEVEAARERSEKIMAGEDITTLSDEEIMKQLGM